MATFGGQTTDFVKGKARGRKQRVELWQRPGVDGYGAQLLGLGDSDATFVLVRYGTLAAVSSWMTLIEAMQGTSVTIVDDDNETITGFLVTRVGQPRIQSADQGSSEKRMQVQVRGVVL